MSDMIREADIDGDNKVSFPGNNQSRKIEPKSSRGTGGRVSAKHWGSS